MFNAWLHGRKQGSSPITANSAYKTVFRGVVTREFTYSVKEAGEFSLYGNTGAYQQPNLLRTHGYEEVRLELWTRIRDWMAAAEEPYIDPWFARIPIKEVRSWNEENGFGDVQDREIGKSAKFNILNSRKSILPPGLSSIKVPWYIDGRKSGCLGGFDWYGRNPAGGC